MRRLRDQSGFTLIELLTAMALFGILVPAITLVLTTSVHWSDDLQEGATVQTEMRATIDRLAADLRQAYTGDGTPILITASPNVIVFYSPDRSTPFRLRKIAYRLMSGNLERSTTTSTNAGGAPWTFPTPDAPFVSQVKGVLSNGPFVYLDRTGTVTTDPFSVRSIGINLTVATGIKQNRPFTYQTSVTMRTAS
jgi:prepilin-type N-terminal cleavage/methylation domain-containing protein